MRLVLLQGSLVLATALVAPTTRRVVYDGPEWTSIQDILGGDLQLEPSTFGTMTVVVGERSDTGHKIVGVVAEQNAKSAIPLKQSSLLVHQHSMATIPTTVNDQDAINTMIAALTAVHCTLPKVEAVGGAAATEENSMVSGKVVILGGSEYACFAAEGLAALGTHVSLVTTNNVKVNHKNVQVMTPAVGDDEIGFATHVGEFDSLLDTASDERPSKRFNNNNDPTDDVMSQGTTLRLLKLRHKCERYVSSMTHAQTIVNKEGVLWGPGKVKNHIKHIQLQLNQINKPANTIQSITPPPSFGRTVQTLLNNGILYKNTKDFLGDNNFILRGWSLKDFMESSMWPTDSSGGGSRMVRYGLPVLDDDDMMNQEMISAPPQTAGAEFFERDEWDRSIQEEEKQRNYQDMKNPYVKMVVGQQGMYDDIVRGERDAVLFLSATWCRTCRTLNPRFTTLARQTMQEYNGGNETGGILFAKADTTTDIGKDLSRLLRVEAVPAFVLFRKGRRYGPTLSISRIPSKMLSAAIERLQSGEEWDVDAVTKQAGETLQ